MTQNSDRIGLFIDTDNLRAAQQRDDDALKLAWAWLEAPAGTVLREASTSDDAQPDVPDERQIIKPEVGLPGSIQLDALRYRFADDAAAGQRAADALLALQVDAHPSLQAAIGMAIMLADASLLLGGLPAFEAQRAAFVNDWAGFAADLLQTQAPIDDQYWQIALQIASGVMLGDATQLHTGVDAFRRVIDEHIHPEGYFKPLAEPEVTDSFSRHVDAVRALTLAAEAATLSSVDLWGYARRDVSLNTAATYLVYYYFYPEKWRWRDELTTDDTAQVFAERGAFIEIVTYRGYPRGVELLLDEQRPLYDAFGGGLTTLTHYPTQKPRQRKKRGGLFGLFGS